MCAGKDKENQCHHNHQCLQKVNTGYKREKGHSKYCPGFQFKKEKRFKITDVGNVME